MKKGLILGTMIMTGLDASIALRAPRRLFNRRWVKAVYEACCGGYYANFPNGGGMYVDF